MSINRTTQQKKLGWILEKVDENAKRFDSKSRNENELQYRIPDHQRFPKWNNDKKKSLIDSVFRNYPIHSIICSKHYDIDGNKVKEYFDIEDGQTRLSILQDYYNNGFQNEEGDYFKDLPQNIQRNFENYEFTIEVIIIEGENNGDEIHEIFDRLQKGQPLKDCDKFWNWKGTPLVTFSIELINSNQLDLYMGTSKFSSKKRDRLSDIVGLISFIIYWNIDTIMYMNNSFKSHFKNIKKDISNKEKQSVYDFVNYYFNIINECYRIYPKRPNERTKKYWNICSDLGLILYDYFENDEMNKSDKQNMWINYFIYSRKNKNFTTGNKELWNNVEGKPTWTQPKYIEARCDRVISFNENLINNNLDEFCNENNIMLLNEVELESDSDSDSDSESE